MFKKDFLWASASAAYQIEGAYQEDGKGVSIWDIYANTPGHTFNGTNGNIACDFYHRYEEDIKLMKEQGLKAYRFSICWTRIFPNGTGEVNQKGLDFYRKVIDLCKENDIEPMITLYHWDLPQSLQDKYDGWESKQVVEDFTNYAMFVIDEFHEKVKYWIVMNEPNVFTELGYVLAQHPPGKKDFNTYLKAFHHTALAHCRVVYEFKQRGYDGMIGSSIAFTPAYARENTKEDQEALQNYYDSKVWWFFEPYFNGAYPARMKEVLDLQNASFEVSKEDEEILQKAKGLSDFIGINYYQSALIAANPLDDGITLGKIDTSGVKSTFVEQGIPGMYKSVFNPKIEYTDWNWAIDPDGLVLGLKELTEKYHKPIVISENGLGAYDTLVVEDGKKCVHDSYRIDFLRKHIDACDRVISQGVDLIAYTTWSFTDLLSWLNGYAKRYGFVYIDFDSQSLERVKKDSFYWYQKVIESNGQVR